MSKNPGFSFSSGGLSEAENTTFSLSSSADTTFTVNATMTAIPRQVEGTLTDSRWKTVVIRGKDYRILPGQADFIAQISNSIHTIKIDKTGNVTSLETTEKELGGIGALHRLTKLGAYYATSLDVSKNPELEELYARGVSTIDVSKNPKLQILWALTVKTLDVTKNPELRELHADAVTELDISKNPKLRILSANAVTTIDVSKNPLIAQLSVNSVRELYITHEKYPNLNRLSATGLTSGISYNKLAAISPELKIICGGVVYTISDWKKYAPWEYKCGSMLDSNGNPLEQ